MNDQTTNVIDLRERLDRGERIPVSELCRARDAELLSIRTAPVTRIPSPAEAERQHLEKTLERHGLTGLGAVAEKRERLLDDALAEHRRLLDVSGEQAVSLGRTRVAELIAQAMHRIEDAIDAMGVGDV